jgi:transglutaminase-like putative cysteine protease
MWLRSRSEITFTVSDHTPFLLMLRPRSGAYQWVARESYSIEPMVPVSEHTDPFGNLCQRLIAPPGPFALRTSAEVLTPDDVDVGWGAPFDEVQTLPDTVLTYLRPTRYCESDRFIDLAHEIVTGVTPGYDQVAALTAWIRRTVRFNSDSPHFQLSAVEVHQAGEGVCRDLAHLGIALCQALCIPARMVVGYLYGLQPMDFHAWFEAFVGGRWFTFDPTQQQARGGRIIVAYGHDAADVALFTQFGPRLDPTRMAVQVERLEGPPDWAYSPG